MYSQQLTNPPQHLVYCAKTFFLPFATSRTIAGNKTVPGKGKHSSAKFPAPSCQLQAMNWWAAACDQITFRGTRSLFAVGAAKKLHPSDLHPLPREESAAELSRIAFAEWDRSKSLFQALWSVTKRPLFNTLPLQILYVILQLAQPLVLRNLLVWISGPSTSTGLIGAGYVLLMFLIRLLAQSVMRPTTYAVCARAGIRAERAAMLLVSRKLLRLRGGTRGTGEIVSALATDAKRFGPDLLPVIHLLWQSPLQIVLASLLMFRFIGVAAFAAVAAMVITSTIMFVVVKRERVCYDAIYKLSDSRIRALTGLLDILRQAKMAAWENVLARDVHDQRKRQMEAIRESCALQGVGRSIWEIAPALTGAAAFGAAVLLPGTPALTADVIFPCLALLETIKVPLRLMPTLSAFYMQAAVSLVRLQRFLEEDEYPGRLQMNTLSNSGVVGRLNGGFIGWMKSNRNEEEGDWSEEQPLTVENNTSSYGSIVPDQATRQIDVPVFTPVLRNINLALEKGTLIIVRGPVAAGKSRFALASVSQFEVTLNRILTSSRRHIQVPCSAHCWVR